MNRKYVLSGSHTALALAVLVASGCTNSIKSKATFDLQNESKPLVAAPAAPLAEVTAAFTVLNYRQCSPVAIPALYNDRNIEQAAQEPVLVIYSVSNEVSPGYYVDNATNRYVIYQRPLKKIGQKWEFVSDQSFTLQLPKDVAEKMVVEKNRNQKIVLSIEDLRLSTGQHHRGKNNLYASSEGLPGHGPIPNGPQQGDNRIFGVGAILPESLATMQIGTILKSSTNERGDLECDGEGDPLVIDFARNGFRTIFPGVSFDLSARGASDNYGWIAPNSGLGFLALDTNGNGSIDNGTELFSNYMSIGGNLLATNGFEALKSFDRPDRGGNNDGHISSSDRGFAHLLVWFDRNSNALTDRGELVPLSQTGVKSINLDYVTKSVTDSAGNKIIGFSNVTTNKGETFDIADLWFRKK